MRVQGIPIDRTPTASRVAGGAGAAMQGFVEGVGALQSLEQQKKLLSLREREIARQEAELARSIQEGAQRFELQSRRQALAERKAQQAEAEQAQAAAGTKSILDAVRARLGAGSAPTPGGPQGAGLGGGQSEEGLGELPPEIEIAFTALRDLPGTGKEKADQAILLGGLTATAAREATRKQFLGKLRQEVASGAWTPQNALGIEIDADGDGTPDEISSIPQKLAQLAGDKNTPIEVVIALHQQATAAIDQQRAQMVRRMSNLQQFDQILATAQPTMTPEASMLAEQVKARYARGGHYTPDAFGEAEVKRDLGWATQGLVPMKLKNGLTVAVDQKDAARAEFDLNGPPADPRLQAVEDFASLADRVFPPFSADPASNQEERDAARKAYTQEKLDFLDAFLKKFGIDTSATWDRVDPSAMQAGIQSALGGRGGAEASGGGSPPKAPVATGTADGEPDPLLDAWLSPEERAEFDKLSPAEQAVVRKGLEEKERGGR